MILVQAPFLLFLIVFYRQLGSRHLNNNYKELLGTAESSDDDDWLFNYMIFNYINIIIIINTISRLSVLYFWEAKSMAKAYNSRCHIKWL